MTLSVGTAALGEQVERYGTSAFLLTAGSSGGPHAVSVRLVWDGTVFRTRAGRTSRSNLGLRPEVTLLWAPVGAEDYSLIVDGRAEAGDDDHLRINPLTAVLHRSPARHAEDPPGSDCVSVLRAGGPKRPGS